MAYFMSDFSVYFTTDSMMFDKDAGHRTFMDDVYECQMRIPGANWISASRPWTNVVSDHPVFFSDE